ncbi:flagellar biosynthesis protein [Maritimibacter sp. HL-12]|uniref:FliH/SctL family protein n=1 Tax=Maritimibacter sp. HL-12 TaxID=1162418 RepID=UPI000A0F3BA4|nr:flagellar biosynthesis protein [Maritimibacter sp. HL-12]SMH43088.1 flagellar assembly protein FliH [Maritimibacter sp. HL-12]
MPRPLLEDFAAGVDAPMEGPGSAGGAIPGPANAPSNELVEASRLEGYEAGYQAGWDDALRAQAEEQGRIGAEFARNLQDLGFTFQEARSHVMHALEPLLSGMVEKVLPRLISETIGQTIIEELMPLAATAADAPIEVVVSPASLPVLHELLAKTISIPFELVEEPSLAEGQVFLRSGNLERHIDFTTAVDRIGAAINSLYELNEKAFNHG